MVEKERIIKIVDRYLGNDYLLFIFGSHAKKTTVKSSDIDLAFYRAEAIPAHITARIKEDIETKAGTLREVDLVNLTDKNISAKLLENIIKEGILWKEPKNSNELLKNLKARLSNSKK